MKTKILVISLAATLLAGWFFAVVVPVTKGYFFFTFDFSRDMLWVKNQIDFGVPAIVGPWGSLNGLFFGPLWYWLLVIPYILGGGSPVAAALFDGAFVLLTIFIGFSLFFKEDKKFAVFFLLFSLASPAMRAIAGYAFAQNMLPLFTLCLLYAYAKLIEKFKLRFLLLAGLSLSLMYHAEPPTAIISILSIIPVIFLSKDRKSFFTIKSITSFLAVFLIPFLTVIVFDLRHQFLQVKAVLSYLQGQNESLQGILPIGERITDRFIKFGGTITGGVLANAQATGIFIGVLAFFNIFRGRDLGQGKFSKNLLIVSVSYLITLIIGFLVFRSELKGFYLTGLFTVSLFFIASFCANTWTTKGQKLLVSLIFIFICWLSFDPPALINAYKEDFKGTQISNGVFSNQLSAVDWIYKTAGGQGFKVYVYSAAIYDYPYQYIFMTHGLQKYGYLPVEFSYLPDKPNYVEKKVEQLSRLDGKIKTPAAFMYLIVDPDKSRESEKINWLRHFSSTEALRFDSRTLIDGTMIEKRLLMP